MSQLVQSLKHFSTTVAPQSVLSTLGPGFRGLLPVDRLGIAIMNHSSTDFENLAVWDRIDPNPASGGLFKASHTAGEWVSRFNCPAVGSDIEQMKPYPETYGYLCRERFNSNLLLPLDLSRYGTGVLYALSAMPKGFTNESIPLGLRIKSIVEPAIRAYLATRELLNGRDESSDITQRQEQHPSEHLLSLEQIQRQHILAVLKRTNWKVEGPRGAAEMLDVNPSTLRNRMRRLGIRK